MGIRNSDQVLRFIRFRSVDITNNVAEQLVARCEEASPVLTGNLRDSFRLERARIPGQSARIYNDAEYFEYVDQGTERQAPANIIETAISSISPDARRYLR